MLSEAAAFFDIGKLEAAFRGSYNNNLSPQM
jgi:hypothetical protein